MNNKEIKKKEKEIQKNMESKSFLMIAILTVSTAAVAGLFVLKKKPKRGMMIVFEGVDRCGKTTQTEVLAKNMKAKGLKVELLRYPNRTSKTGKIINDYLQNKSEINDEEIHQLFSDNRWEDNELIQQKLNQGVNLIVDRYAFSGVCFTASKFITKDMKENEILEILSKYKKPDIGLVKPDIVLFLDLTIENAMKRGNFGDERYEKKDFQITVRNTFHTLMKQDDTKMFHIIDAFQTVEEVTKTIENTLEENLKQLKKDNKPIEKLWI